MVFREVSGAELIDAFAAGIYLLFGVIHLDLWLKRRDRPSHLWLAAAGLGALMVDLTGMALRYSPRESGLVPTLNVLGALLVTASLLELVFTLSGEVPDRWTRSALAVGLLLALVGGSGLLAAAGPLFFALSAALLLRGMVHAFRAGLRGDPESRAIAAGLVVLLVSLIVDLLGILGVIALPSGIPVIGFVVLFLVAAIALNARYEREHRELVALRNDLEERVSIRTRELEEANLRLAEASRTDALTGLPNRRGFLDVADHELKRSVRAGEPFSVVMVDLDHFKQINDRHGHGAGDAVLQQVATRLRNVLRSEDLVARWGGEEFIVLLPNTTGELAVFVAEKARRAIAELRFDEVGVGSITASFGVAMHHPGHPLDTTIAAADGALYRAKEAGRDCVLLAQ